MRIEALGALLIALSLMTGSAGQALAAGSGDRTGGGDYAVIGQTEEAGDDKAAGSRREADTDGSLPGGTATGEGGEEKAASEGGEDEEGEGAEPIGEEGTGSNSEGGETGGDPAGNTEDEGRDPAGNTENEDGDTDEDLTEGDDLFGGGAEEGSGDESEDEADDESEDGSKDGEELFGELRSGLRASPSYVTGGLPDQGMYAIICAADQSYAVGTGGNSISYGAPIETQPWDRRPSEAWIIRRAQGNYYYIKAGKNFYYRSNPRATIGWNSGEAISLMDGWFEDNQPEGELWQISMDSTGLCTFTHKATGKVLDVAGGTPGSGVRLQVHRSNNTSAQRFYLIDLKTHDIAYTVTNRTSTENIGRNTLEISNLNSLSLPQNQMAAAQSLGNISYGSGVTVTAETGFANKSNWALASDGESLLPAYRVEMSAASPGSEAEFIEVTYPEAGRYFDGTRTIRLGARVRFSNIVPADVLSQRYDWTASTPADGHKTLVIGTNLFSGFWYNNITKMDVTVTFFDAVTGAGIPLSDAYMTFNSLSNNMQFENLVLGRDIACPSTDAYGEFVGIKNKAVTGYVSGPPGNSSSSDSEPVTNIVSMDLEIWPPYAEAGLNAGVQPVFIGQAKRYPGSANLKEAAWTDALGETNFTRNSVSLPLESSGTTTFVIGSLKGEAWNSFSSAPIYANVEPPVKMIAGASGEGSEFDSEAAGIPLYGGEAVFRVIQKIPQIGFDTAEALSYLTVSDNMRDEFEILDVRAEPADGFAAVSGTVAEAFGAAEAELSDAWSIERNGQTVTFTYTGNYREMLDDGSGTPQDSDKVIVGSFLIRVKPSDSAQAGGAIPNKAVTRWSMTSGGPDEAESNDVTVTPFENHAETGIPVLNAGGPGAMRGIIAGILLLVCLLAACIRRRLRSRCL